VPKLKMPTGKTAIKMKKRRGATGGMSMGTRVKAIKLEPPVEPMGLIHGKQPGSSYEWHIAQALEKYGWEYQYQVPVLTGKRLAGGQVLDFLVKTIPMWTALAVDGEYWHRNDARHKMTKDIAMISALRKDGYSVRGDVLHAGDADAETTADARQFVLKEFGRA